MTMNCTNRCVTVVIIGTLAVSVPIGRQQASWIHASQVRVAETSKTLGSVKWLRLSGLNDMAFCRLRSLRTHELAVSERFRYLLGVSLILCKLLKEAEKVDVEANYFLTSSHLHPNNRPNSHSSGLFCAGCSRP